MKFRGKYTPVRVFRMSFAMSILAAVYYLVIRMAADGQAHWPSIIFIPLFALFCLYYEAASHTINVLQDALSVSAGKGGGGFKSAALSRTRLAYKDIAGYTGEAKLSR